MDVARATQTCCPDLGITRRWSWRSADLCEYRNICAHGYELEFRQYADDGGGSLWLPLAPDPVLSTTCSDLKMVPTARILPSPYWDMAAICASAIMGPLSSIFPRPSRRDPASSMPASANRLVHRSMASQILVVFVIPAVLAEQAAPRAQAWQPFSGNLSPVHSLQN